MNDFYEIFIWLDIMILINEIKQHMHAPKVSYSNYKWNDN